MQVHGDDWRRRRHARAAGDRAGQCGRDDRRRPAAVHRGVDRLARRRERRARGDRAGDRARARRRGRAAAHRHVRRHAVEPRHDVPRDRPRRGHHRRQPADADQAGRPARARRTCSRVAREMREHGRNAIWVASDLLRGEKAQRHDVADRHRREPARACTRGRPRSSSTWRRASSAQVRVARDGREMDGKSIMGILLLAAARGTTITITRRRRRRDATPSTALVRARRVADSARTHAAPDGHRRLAGRRRRPRGHPDPARRRCCGITIAAGARRRTSSRASSRAATRSRAAAARHPRAASPAAAGPSSASLFDAQLLMLDDPMLVPRAADARPRAARQRRVGASSRSFDEFSAVFDEVADPYLRERKGDVADLVGRLRMNLRAGRRRRRAICCASSTRRRCSIADELTPSLAAQVDWTQGARLRDRRRQPHVSHRDPRALARGAGRRRPARRQPARSSPGSSSSSTATASEVIVDPDDGDARRASRAAPTTTGPAAGADAERRRPAATADGVRIRLEANIEFPDDLRGRALRGRRGHRPLSVGVPAGAAAAATSSEDEQYEVYRGMLEGMAPGPVTVRTFDVDEDQLALAVGAIRRSPAAGSPTRSAAAGRGCAACA